MTQPTREIQHAHDLYRYRKATDIGDQDFVIEVYHPARDEWRVVKNTSSRDWFAIGFRAGLQAAAEHGVQGEMFG